MPKPPEMPGPPGMPGDMPTITPINDLERLLMAAGGGGERALLPGYEQLEALRRVSRPAEVQPLVIDTVAVALRMMYGEGVVDPSLMRSLLAVTSLSQMLATGAEHTEMWVEKYPGLANESDPFLVGYFEAERVLRLATSIRALYEFAQYLADVRENVDATVGTVTEGRHPDYPEAVSFGFLYNTTGREIPEEELINQEDRERAVAKWLLGDEKRSDPTVLKFVEARRFGFMLARARKHLRDVADGKVEGVVNPFGCELNRRTHEMAMEYVARELFVDFGFNMECMADEVLPVGSNLSMVDLLHGLTEDRLVAPVRKRLHPGLASTREAFGAAALAFLIFDLNQSDIASAGEYAGSKNDLTLGRRNDGAKLPFLITRILLEAKKGRATGLRWVVGASFPSLTCEFGDLVVFEQKLLDDKGEVVKVDAYGKRAFPGGKEWPFARPVTRKVTMNMLLDPILSDKGELAKDKEGRVLWPGLPETLLPWGKAKGGETKGEGKEGYTVLTESDLWGAETINAYFEAMVSAGKVNMSLKNKWQAYAKDGYKWSDVPVIDDDKYFSMWVQIMYAGKIFSLLTWPDDKAEDLAKLIQTQSFWRKNVKPFQVALGMRAAGHMDIEEFQAYQAWSRAVVVGAAICGTISTGFEADLPQFGENSMAEKTIKTSARKGGFLDSSDESDLGKKQARLINKMVEYARKGQALVKTVSPSAVEAGFVAQEVWDRWVSLGLVDTIK